MQAGQFHVGLRTDDEEHLALLRRTYSPYLVDDPRAGADLNLIIRPPTTGPRGLPYLAHGRQPLMRTRSLRRLVRRLDLFLGSLSDPETALAEVRNMGALVRGHRAVLVPTDLLERSTAVEQLARECGAAISEAAGTRLDLTTGEVVATAGLSGWGVRMQDHLAPRPGRYRVVAICWPAKFHADDERPATALLRLAQHLVTSDDLSGLLQHLPRFRSTFSTLAIGTTGTTDIREALELL